MQVKSVNICTSTIQYSVILDRKQLIAFFFSFIIANLYSQTLYVEYEQNTFISDQFGSFKLNAVLLAEGNLSNYTIFLNGSRFQDNLKIIDDGDDDMSYHVLKIADVGETSTLIYNKLNNSLSQDYLDDGQPTIIEDMGVVLNWQITNEQKNLQDFSCTKAILNFRGREFIAWFTTEIPVAHGPWKFHGLPGLILEVHDVNNIFGWSAVKITYPFKSDIKLKSEHSSANSKTISLKEYIEAQTKKREKEEKMRISKMPKDSKIVESSTQNNSIELIYEWELESKVKLKD